MNPPRFSLKNKIPEGAPGLENKGPGLQGLQEEGPGLFSAGGLWEMKPRRRAWAEVAGPCWVLWPSLGSAATVTV